jgi:hypothetical protein
MCFSGMPRISGCSSELRCLRRTHEGQFDDFNRRGRLRTGLDRYPNSFSALHLGLARPARLSDTLVKSRPRSAARLAAKGTPNKINSAARMCPNRAGTDQLDPNSGTTARLTNGIWNFALSPAYTKSQCVSMVVPPQWRRPARPLSAACRNRHSSARTAFIKPEAGPICMIVHTIRASMR